MDPHRRFQVISAARRAFALLLAADDELEEDEAEARAWLAQALAALGAMVPCHACGVHVDSTVAHPDGNRWLCAECWAERQRHQK